MFLFMGHWLVNVYQVHFEEDTLMGSVELGFGSRCICILNSPLNFSE